MSVASDFSELLKIFNDTNNVQFLVVGGFANVPVSIIK